MTTERRYRRRAAGKVMFAAFHTCNTVASSMLLFNRLEWGEDLFTESEREYLAKVRTRIYADGEYLRKMGHKLCK